MPDMTSIELLLTRRHIIQALMSHVYSRVDYETYVISWVCLPVCTLKKSRHVLSYTACIAVDVLPTSPHKEWLETSQGRIVAHMHLHGIRIDSERGMLRQRQRDWK
jgi:hypothetical protein